MRRRALLGSIAAGAAAVLAGCGHPPPGASLNFDPVTAEHAERYAREFDTIRPEGRETVAAAVADGEATGESDGARAPFVRDGDYLVTDGTYYRVRTTLVGERERTGHQLFVEYLADDREPEGDPAVVAYDALPTVDQEAFDEANPDGMIGSGGSIGAGVFFQYGDRASDSRFVGSESLIVTYRGEEFLVRYGGEETRGVKTFRYETSRVAESATDFAATLVDAYGFTLDPAALSEKQRSIVADASDDDEYREETPISSAFQDLIDRLREHEPLNPTFPEVYVVGYEGTDYFADLNVIGPAEEGEGPGTRTSRRPYRTQEGAGGAETTDGSGTTEETSTPSETPPPTDG